MNYNLIADTLKETFLFRKKKSLLFTAVATLGLTAATMAQPVPSYVPTNGLAGYWPFNGNANDESGNGNNGTVNGATLTSDRFGNVNKAYSFDGNLQHLLLPPMFDAGFNEFTITVWFWSDAVQTGFSEIMQQDVNAINSALPDNSIDLRYYNNLSSFQGSLAAPYPNIASFLVNPVPTTQQWHFAVLNKSTTNFSLYIDNVVINTSNFSGTYNSFGQNIFIGNINYPAYPLNCGFSGLIDDIGIWNRALTACEIQDLYHSQLNSASGIVAGNDATVCEGDQVILTGAGGSNYQWSGGITDNMAFSANSTQDYILIGETSNSCLGMDTVTVNVNLLPNVDAGNDLIVCEGDQIVLNGSGADSYLWDNSVTDGVIFTASNSQTYTVIGSSSNNCENTDQITVTVNENSSSILNESGMDSVNVNETWYSQNGQYTQVIQNEAGCDSTITINVSLTFTGINENSPNNLFTVFPNPAQSIINVKADNKLMGEFYSIYDNTGRVVLTGKLNSQHTTIELGNLSGGIYMFSVGENMKQTFKVIKE